MNSRRLAIIGFVISILMLFGWFVASVAGATTWGSYSDPAHAVPCESFAEYHDTIYAYGTGFIKNTWYTIKWTDGGGQVILTEVNKSGGNGLLESCHVVNDTNAPGLWYSRVYLSTTLVASDTFTVEASAVPEFPTMLSGLMVAGACTSIFWKLRRRHENVISSCH